jgi:hypothetical protein
VHVDPAFEQSSVHVAPARQFTVQFEPPSQTVSHVPPPQVMLHVEFASQSLMQPLAEQS